MQAELPRRGNAVPGQRLRLHGFVEMVALINILEETKNDAIWLKF